MSERFSRQSSAGVSGHLSGRGTAPPKRAPTPQRRHTLSSLSEIPPLPPRRMDTGRVRDSDSDSDTDMPRVRTRLPPTSGRGRPVATGSLPTSRNATPIRGASPVRYLDGSPKPMIIKTMPFGRTNSQPVYSETSSSSGPQMVRRGSAKLDSPDNLAETYSSGMALNNAHPPLVPHTQVPSRAMPPLAPTSPVPMSPGEPSSPHAAALPPRPPAEPVSQETTPLYPTEKPAAPAPAAAAGEHERLATPSRQPHTPPRVRPASPARVAASPPTEALYAAPPLPPVAPPRRASPPLARATAPATGMRASPRPGRPSEARVESAGPTSSSYATGAPPRPARAAAASAATLPRGPPPLAPRTAVDDGWSGFSPRPELPGRRPPMPYGSARGVPREKPAADTRHAPQSSRRPTQSVQTARERAAQRRRAASSSPTAHRMAGSTPTPGDRDANMFPGAKRVEANDRVSVKHAVLLAAGVVTAIITGVVLARALFRTSASSPSVVPKVGDSPVSGGGGGGAAAVAGEAAAVPKSSQRGTLPVMLGPPVGARSVAKAAPQSAKVALSATGENPHEAIADIRERVIGALVG